MASIARAVPREIVGAQCEGMRTASDGLQIEQSWSAQVYPGDFWSEIMQITHFTLIMQFIAIMQVCTNTRTNNDTWKSLSIPCTFIWLLSSGSAGMSRLAWDSAWYSKKYRPSLSGSTDRILYAPYSHICHAELIPMGLQRCPRYVLHHLSDDALTASVSWPAPRYCIRYLKNYAFYAFYAYYYAVYAIYANPCIIM